jgi:hypothetical protein
MLTMALSMLIFAPQAHAGKKAADVEEKVEEELKIDCSGATGLKGGITDTHKGLSLDLGTSTAVGALSLEHKLDIDAHEDRCITDVKVTSHIDETGCEVLLHYRSTDELPGLNLIGAHFVADSFCPGWDDNVESTYVWIPGRSVPTLSLSKKLIDERTARESCVDISAQVSGDLLTVADGRRVTLKFDDMLVQGSFPSRGDTQGVCGVVEAPSKAVIGGVKNTASLQLGFASLDGGGSLSIGPQYARLVGKRTALTFFVGQYVESEGPLLLVGFQSFVQGSFTQGVFIDYTVGTILNPSPIAVTSLKGGYKYTFSPGISVEAKLGTTAFIAHGQPSFGIESGIGVGWSF